MQRTLNYTGRKSIEQKQAIFSFTNREASPPEFNVVFDIDPIDYPENASLYVEAYHKETKQRFSFGSVSNITPPKCRILDEIDLSGPTLFRVLIVDESGRHGLLRASGELFRADSDDDEDSKASLISVRPYDLGQLAWRVFFSGGMAPELHINNRIPNGIEKIRTDPAFQSLILPAMLRDVLVYYLWNDEVADEDEYCERWMSFASLFAENKPESDDPTELLNWIDETVTGFSKRFQLTDMLVTAYQGDE